MNTIFNLGFAKVTLGMVTGFAVAFAFTGSADQIESRKDESALVQLAEMDLFNVRNSEQTRRRAMAVLLARDPSLFVKLDEQFNNEIFNSFIEMYAGLNRPTTSLQQTNVDLLTQSKTNWGEQAGLIAVSAQDLRQIRLETDHLLDASFQLPVRQMDIDKLVIRHSKVRSDLQPMVESVK